MNTQKIMRVTVSAIMVIVAVVAVINIYGGGTNSSATESAEKYANSQLYSTYGIVADRMTSDVIYSDGADKLVEIKFYYDGECFGVCCVHTGTGSVALGCTTIMMPDYDFEDNLRSTKALFGL